MAQPPRALAAAATTVWKPADLREDTANFGKNGAALACFHVYRLAHFGGFGANI